jgi:hypothetical protein
VTQTSVGKIMGTGEGYEQPCKLMYKIYETMESVGLKTNRCNDSSPINTVAADPNSPPV